MNTARLSKPGGGGGMMTPGATLNNGLRRPRTMMSQIQAAARIAPIARNNNTPTLSTPLSLSSAAKKSSDAGKKEEKRQRRRDKDDANDDASHSGSSDSSRHSQHKKRHKHHRHKHDIERIYDSILKGRKKHRSSSSKTGASTMPNGMSFTPDAFTAAAADVGGASTTNGGGATNNNNNTSGLTIALPTYGSYAPGTTHTLPPYTANGAMYLPMTADMLMQRGFNQHATNPASHVPQVYTLDTPLQLFDPATLECPLTALIMGDGGSGKTTLTNNFFRNWELRFDILFVFTKAPDAAKIYAKHTFAMCVMPEFNQAVVEPIVECLNAAKYAEGRAASIAFIGDDFVDKKVQKNEYFAEIVKRIRHSNITLWIMMHRFDDLDDNFQNSAHLVGLMYGAPETLTNKVYTNWFKGKCADRRVFNRMISTYLTEPGTAILMNKRRNREITYFRSIKEPELDRYVVGSTTAFIVIHMFAKALEAASLKAQQNGLLGDTTGLVNTLLGKQAAAAAQAKATAAASAAAAQDPSVAINLFNAPLLSATTPSSATAKSHLPPTANMAYANHLVNRSMYDANNDRWSTANGGTTTSSPASPLVGAAAVAHSSLLKHRQKMAASRRHR